VLKYTVVSLATMIAIVVGLFSVIAWRNGDGAEAGPPPLVVVRADGETLVPSSIEVQRGRLVQLQLVNDGPLRLEASTAGGVQQLPPESDSYDYRAPTQPLPYLALVAPPGGANHVYARFTEPGERLITVQTPDRPETARTLVVTVR
jgi:hypothetical protein